MTEQKTTAYHQLVYLFLFTPTTDMMYFLERSKDFFWLFLLAAAKSVLT